MEIIKSSEDVIYDFIIDYHIRNKIPPSTQQIVSLSGKNRYIVRKWLKKLESRGWIYIYNEGGHTQLLLTRKGPYDE